MALVTGRLEGRDLGSAVAEDPRPAAGDDAARRLHLRDWRTVRIAAHRVSRAAGGVRPRGGARLHDSRDPLPRLDAGHPHPVGRAAVARRRAAAAPAHGRRPERLLGHGPHPAGGSGREERHHAARPVRIAACRGRALRVGHRASRADSSPSDSDDHALHAVRPAPARAGTRPRRGSAEAPRAGRDWRPRALHAGHAAGRARACMRPSRDVRVRPTRTHNRSPSSSTRKQVPMRRLAALCRSPRGRIARRPRGHVLQADQRDPDWRGRRMGLHHRRSRGASTVRVARHEGRGRGHRRRQGRRRDFRYRRRARLRRSRPTWDAASRATAGRTHRRSSTSRR